MKEETSNHRTERVSPITPSVQKVDDRDEISRLLLFETERLTKEAFSEKNRIFEMEARELLNGASFSIYDKKEEFKQFIAEKERNYEPKFSQFFRLLGDLFNWTEEERRNFRKPRIVALTINEVIYKRFPEGLLEYVQMHNRYIGYCLRRTKNYKLLNDDGILRLEKYIDDANMIMPKCSDYYTFRVKMFEQFGVSYQMDLFRS
ncbi:P63C domain-containing protein [Pararcticibacter amylolyticus]|uniref:Bacteriophage Mx8 p63 C-terminal domain-containing protein n=1 Tax=Pararcticibacter amylolyticus TaxID=2173175 RepID=A0A2U2P9I4_9SPHI|nr:P63C domain-containing protein [Pararcticibacter amylolyticus]PWG78056.1 hypothetical protein DDR33_24260 [Pararcticibacter amylolyticus]